MSELKDVPIPAQAMLLLAAYGSLPEDDFNEIFDRAAPVAQRMFLETLEEWADDGDDEEE